MCIVNFAFSIKLQPLRSWTGTVVIHTSDLSRLLQGKLFDEGRTVDAIMVAADPIQMCQMMRLRTKRFRDHSDVAQQQLVAREENPVGLNRQKADSWRVASEVADIAALKDSTKPCC
jgi:hypothetical protein